MNASSSESTKSVQKKKTTRSVSRRACLSCREKKIKCDGVQVCRNCQALKIQCIFIRSNRGGRRKKGISEQQQQQQQTGTVTTTPSSSSISSTAAPAVIPPPPPPHHHHQHPHHPHHPPPPYVMTNVQPPPPVPTSAPPPAPAMTTPHHPLTNSISSSSIPRLYHYHHHHHPHPHHPNDLASTSSSTTPPPPNPSTISPSSSTYTLPSIASLNEGLESSTSAPAPTSAPTTNNKDQTNHNQSPEGIQERLLDLQSQINQIKSRLPSAGPIVQVGIPYWQVTEQDLATMDLPPSHLANHLVDLYYQHFHPNHPFMYPKAAFFRYLKLTTGVAIVHAMFSVSCRFLNRNNVHGLHAYMRDPQYWIDNSKKYSDTLCSEDQVKAMLIIGLGLQADAQFDMARDYIQRSRQLIEYHRLDKRHTSQAGIDRDIEYHALAISNPCQLLERESLIRTIWECWRAQVQACFVLKYYYNSSTDFLPHFNSNLCLPVPNVEYEQELINWDRRRIFWSDFENELLTGPASNGKIQTFYDTTFVIAATQVLGAAVRNVEVPMDTRSSLDTRVRTIDGILPHHHESTTVPQFLLYVTTILMHGQSCLKACVFYPKFTQQHDTPAAAAKSPKSHSANATIDEYYFERSIESAYHSLQSDTNVQHSFLLCSWAADGLKRLLNPIEDSNKKTSQDSLIKYWHRLYEYFGTSIEFAIVLYCTELMFSRYSKQIPGDANMKSTNQLTQDLQFCLSFLDEASCIWKVIEISRDRAKVLYDKTVGSL